MWGLWPRCFGYRPQSCEDGDQNSLTFLKSVDFAFIFSSYVGKLSAFGQRGFPPSVEKRCCICSCLIGIKRWLTNPHPRSSSDAKSNKLINELHRTLHRFLHVYVKVSKHCFSLFCLDFIRRALQSLKHNWNDCQRPEKTVLFPPHKVIILVWLACA